MAERLPARVPENPENIIRFRDRVFILARRRENLHHVRKWCWRAAGILRRSGFRDEALVFSWLHERARLGLAYYPQEGPLDRAERMAARDAVGLYSGVRVQAFERLMSVEISRGRLFRASMLVGLR